MLKRGILSVIVFFVSLSVLAQTGMDINYKNKSLVKTLTKSGLTDISKVQEIILPDSLLSQPMKGKFFRIESENVSKYKYIYVGRVNSCRAGGCSISNNSSDDGNSEYFDYFMLFDKNKTVRLVQVFNYQATHGQEVTSRGWLKQFVGHDSSQKLRVNKNVDSISGATISVYVITNDVELKTKLLHVFNG